MSIDITALPPVTPEMLASLKLSASNLAEGELMSFEPAVFRAQVEALEARDKQIAFLKEQLAQLVNFNPDWDRLEAATDSLREHMAELNSAQARIAELESRTVTVKLPEVDRPIDGTGYAHEAGAQYYRERVIKSLSAAGIQVIEGEGQ